MKYFKLFCTMLIALLILTPIVCLGNDTNKITNYSGDTFQDYDEGTNIIGVRGWHADPGDDIVIAVIVSTNMTYTNYLPIINGTGSGVSQVLSLETGANVLTNEFDQTAGQNTVYVDLLVQMNPADKNPNVATNDTSLQAAVWKNAESNLVLRAGILFDGGAVITTNFTLSNTVVDDGEWIRLTFQTDYLTDAGQAWNAKFIKLFLNGVAITNADAWSDPQYVADWNSPPANGGAWFIMANTSGGGGRTYFSSLELSGAGLFDNVDVTTDAVVFGPATMYTVTVDSVVGGDIWPGQTNEVSTASEIFFQASNGFYISLITRDGGDLPLATNYTVEAPNISTTVVITATFGTNATDNSISNNVPAEWMQKVLGIYADDYAVVAADDPDLDGYSTADEFLMSSDPFDSNDFLRISSVTLNGSGEPEIRWRSNNLDTNYYLPPFDVLLATNMTGGPAWEPGPIASTNRVEGPHTNVVTLPAHTEIQYYYKVVATNN